MRWDAVLIRIEPQARDSRARLRLTALQSAR
jgi:hypothetical protein